MLLERLKSKLPELGMSLDVSIEKDVIEVRVQENPVFWITSECYGFKIYIGYEVPNSVEFSEVETIKQTVENCIFC